MTIFRILPTAIFLVATVLLGMPAHAQQQDTPLNLSNIAVVNIDKIRTESEAFKSGKEQILKYSEDTNTSLQQSKDALRTANEELGRKRTVLAPDAFAAERQKFEQNVSEFQSRVQEQQKAMNQMHANMVGEINKNIIQIIAELSQERGYLLVLRGSSIVLRADVMNIDDEVLKRLNEKMPTVSVPTPGQ